MKQPRILFLCDRPSWAYDLCARALSERLEGDFHFEIKYSRQRPSFAPEDYDLVYVFWWGETYHRLMLKGSVKVAKEVSSHRWEAEDFFGKIGPDEALKRYMHDASTLVVTSRRLLSTFDPLHPHVQYYPLGVDVRIFRPVLARSGPLSVGWAGDIADGTKGVKDILLPACGDTLSLRMASGERSHVEMSEFYNELDVICVASLREGTPLPLIEAMACGCFPVCTDVGVVPELIEHGRNGLIVERNTRAFREAFQWCRENLDLVRTAGPENAKLIASSRSWDKIAPTFGSILAEAVERARNHTSVETPSRSKKRNPTYSRHLMSLNPGGFSEEAYRAMRPYYWAEIDNIIPEARDTNILEIGSGFGHLLHYLADNGYRRLTGVDISEELLDGTRRQIGDRLERLEVAEAREFLRNSPNEYDCIIMFDMIEHLSESEALEAIGLVYSALRPGGRVIIRTPNMANILGCYSRFIDITHRHAYTEFSITQLLENAGFDSINLHVPKRFVSPRRAAFARLNRLLHRVLFRIMDRPVPQCLDKNLIVWATRAVTPRIDS